MDFHRNANSHPIYEATIGYRVLNELIENACFSKVVIFSDETVYDLWAQHLLSELHAIDGFHTILIDSGEEQKSLEICKFIYEELVEIGADKQTLLINFGGGVVTDIGGFIAATFKRGIRFVNIPTTILGMVDAALGGKNGVDLGAVKNQIGTTKMPELVLIDMAFAESLDVNQVLSGMAEMLKHGAIANESVFAEFEQAEDLDLRMCIDLVMKSAEIKMNIVAADPFDEGLRQVLNFGHTVGHAIETHLLLENSPQTVYHGFCVAAGMLIESHLALCAGSLDERNFERLARTVDRYFERIPLSEDSIPKIIELMKSDKKNSHGKIKYVPIHSIGAASAAHVAEIEMIEKSLNFYRT